MASNAKISFGCETMIVESGLTIKQTWQKVAGDFGASPDRPVTFRKNGFLVSPDATVEPDAEYAVTVSHEQKGGQSYKGRSKAAQKRREDRTRLARLAAIGVKVTRAA